ncbi:MaoC/PaaZ C-terminal domain-containing protein [Reyranella sp.]|uniref:MaoC/PaaZ C-terminal domain-containing protein n=1 Tax=Reyranella sp. TaxID=1929291 RepID=UPI00272FECD2|nr:MaoC/PaaZ C-terminal domain-containing protein [Reyranella sp.]MDP2374376.1 MaoC/PaaZ C-terminal domain-containing protein [Reyranella sp.]
MKYYEDFAVGSTFDSRDTYKISAEEIKGFAQKWDPWPYHLDDEQARTTLIGRLFAPSVLTFCVSVKLAHTTEYYQISSVAGLGIDKLQMRKPVFAGDELTVRLTVVEKRESKSKPNMGVMVKRIEVFCQDGDVVLSYLLSGLVNKRP